jgi:hypothetical protein
MIVADGHGLSIGLHAASAQPHENTLAETTLATVRVPGRRGRPRTRSRELMANRAYGIQAFRRYLRRRGIKATICTSVRQPERHPKRGGPIRTGPQYRRRWKVERCFGGWITVGGWSCVMSAALNISEPSV